MADSGGTKNSNKNIDPNIFFNNNFIIIIWLILYLLILTFFLTKPSIDKENVTPLYSIVITMINAFLLFFIAVYLEVKKELDLKFYNKWINIIGSFSIFYLLLFFIISTKIINFMLSESFFLHIIIILVLLCFNYDILKSLENNNSLKNNTIFKLFYAQFILFIAYIFMIFYILSEINVKSEMIYHISIVSEYLLVIFLIILFLYAFILKKNLLYDFKNSLSVNKFILIFLIVLILFPIIIGSSLNSVDLEIASANKKDYIHSESFFEFKEDFKNFSVELTVYNYGGKKAENIYVKMELSNEEKIVGRIDSIEGYGKEMIKFNVKNASDDQVLLYYNDKLVDSKKVTPSPFSFGLTISMIIIISILIKNKRKRIK